METKKAQSQIITTVLIILLVLAAIVIVWQVVQGTIRGGADEIEDTTACVGTTMSVISARELGTCSYTGGTSGDCEDTNDEVITGVQADCPDKLVTGTCNIAFTTATNDEIVVRRDAGGYDEKETEYKVLVEGEAITIPASAIQTLSQLESATLDLPDGVLGAGDKVAVSAMIEDSACGLSPEATAD